MEKHWMSPWEQFKVGKPAESGFNSKCKEFTTISHTCHIDTAIKILEQRKIEPSLIYDKSILNEQRILVSWLSPNHWAPGFRYGNIKLDFEFTRLIENKDFYWVESIDYNPPACRVLITNNDYSSFLDYYDPTIPNGPWWHDEPSNKHYYNGEYCLEFMFESAIPPRRLDALYFVLHHPDYCSIHRTDPRRCTSLGLNSSRAGAIFLSKLAASKTMIDRVNTKLVRSDGLPDDGLYSAFSIFYRDVIRKTECVGNVGMNTKLGLPLARAICSAYSHGGIDDAIDLASMFTNEQELEDAIAIVFSEVVGLDNWKYLVEE